MTVTKPGWLAVAALATLVVGTPLTTPVALADPATDQQPVAVDASHAADQPEFGEGPHNVVYRARVDGVSRGASITYKLSDSEFNTADPTMVPGRMFEATGVVSDPREAGMQVSIQWPYSASLHCEILVDDQVVAQADQFVAPRITPQRNDPGYGVLSCGTVTNFPTGNTAPLDTPPPLDPAVVPVDPGAGASEVDSAPNA